MGAKTHIQWTDATWNTTFGCSIKSPGCTNCYAMALAGTRLATHPMYSGTTDAVNGRHVFNGTLKHLPMDHKNWLWPLRWRGPKVTKRGPGFKPLVFVGDMSDLFHEDRDVEPIDRTWAVMALAEHIDFQVLTKRPERLRDYLNSTTAPGRIWFHVTTLTKDVEKIARASDRLDSAFSNVWIGTSIEDQKRADERIPLLLDTPAAIRFISAEPLLGEVRLHDIDMPDLGGVDALTGDRRSIFGDRLGRGHKLDWVIVGGESGDHARDSVVRHQRRLVQQCVAAGVAVFEKQLGSRPVDHEGVRHAVSGKGGDMAEWPKDLRIREFPRVSA